MGKRCVWNNENVFLRLMGIRRRSKEKCGRYGDFACGRCIGFANFRFYNICPWGVGGGGFDVKLYAGNDAIYLRMGI